MYNKESDKSVLFCGSRLGSGGRSLCSFGSRSVVVTALNLFGGVDTRLVGSDGSGHEESGEDGKQADDAGESPSGFFNEIGCATDTHDIVGSGKG